MLGTVAVIDTSSKMVKDVARYEITRLLVDSEGTFGSNHKKCGSIQFGIAMDPVATAKRGFVILIQWSFHSCVQTCFNCRSAQ